MIKRLYLISGMGAGEEIFKDLDFGDLETIFIPWLKIKSSESYTDYVKRMAGAIDQTLPFGILGVSLGGITAQEMTRYVNPACLILISTIKSHRELPPVARVAAEAGVQRIIPNQFFKWAAQHAGTLVGMKESKELYRQMIDRYGEEYYNWCINAVAEWRGVEHSVPFLHLHGDRDVVFPHFHIHNARIIKGGTHFMVMNKGKEVSMRIGEFLREVKSEK